MIVTTIAVPTNVMLSVLQVNKLLCFAGLDMRPDRRIMRKSCGVILVLLEELFCRIDFSFLYFLLP